jgi:hypothetical protein
VETDFQVIEPRDLVVIPAFNEEKSERDQTDKSFKHDGDTG